MNRARPLGMLLLLVGSAAMAYGCAGPSSQRDERRAGEIGSWARKGGVSVIAHRGDSASAPENTLRAIELGFDHGADVVEVDVHVSRDGVPVIIHDDTLEATTNGHGRVADKTLAELWALDAGSWKGPAHAGERIPTLREALETARDRGSLLIDPKRDGMGETIARVFREARVPTTDAVVGAWNDGQVADFTRHLAGAMILLSDNAGTPRTWNPEFFARARARGIRGFEAGNHWSAAFVAQARSHGMPVYAYTVNDEPTMRHLIDMGIQGIETDALAALVNVAKGPNGSRPSAASISAP